MRKNRILYIFLLFCFVMLFAGTAYAEESTEVPAWALPSIQETDRQVFLVEHIGGANAIASMYDRQTDGTWHCLFSCNAYVGINGTGRTREGMSMTPAGRFRFTEAFGINPDPGCAAFPYHQLTWNDYWSGDQRPGYAYNKMVDINDYPGLDTGSSEHLIECAGFYEYCLNISWNEACIPGEGSAIFLHCMNPSMPYTEGCVAIPQENMICVLQHVVPDCAVIIS